MKLRNIWEGKHNSIHKLIKFRFFQTVAALLWEWRPEYYIKSRGGKGQAGLKCYSMWLFWNGIQGNRLSSLIWTLSQKRDLVNQRKMTFPFKPNCRSSVFCHLWSSKACCGLLHTSLYCSCQIKAEPNI